MAETVTDRSQVKIEYVLGPEAESEKLLNRQMVFHIAEDDISGSLVRGPAIALGVGVLSCDVNDIALPWPENA